MELQNGRFAFHASFPKFRIENANEKWLPPMQCTTAVIANNTKPSLAALNSGRIKTCV